MATTKNARDEAGWKGFGRESDDNSGDGFASPFPGYERREGQMQMAEAVTRALDWKQPLVVEAGTGTGKSLAYLLPVAESGRKTIISTATLALQQQILERDIPLAEKLLGRKLRVACLKGISNYLCQRKLRQLSLFESKSSGFSKPLRNWMHSTETGLLSEFPDLPADDRQWKNYTTTSDARLGARCPEFERCFVSKARRDAENADIVIVNHHLFFSDLKLRADSFGKQVLPDYDAVIFDEAHHAPSAIADRFGESISKSAFSSIVFECHGLERPEVSALAAKLEESVELLFQALEKARQSLGSEKEQRLPVGFLRENAEEEWYRVDSGLEAICALAGADETPDWQSMPIVDRADSLRNTLANFGENRSEEVIIWAEQNSGGTVFRRTPLASNSLFRKHLFPLTKTVIFTSATLSLGESFDFSLTRLGLAPEEAEELKVPSPFDYAKQAIIYLPRDLPLPSDQTFDEKAAERTQELLSICGGRAFLLFTSLRAMRRCRELLPELPYPIFMQGETSKEKLLRDFRNSETSILLGTNTFWEGVDVPGPSLSLVIVQKLPFEPHTRPTTQATLELMEKTGRDPFMEYQLPVAGIRLAQGLGRLIRKSTDVGILSILDRRIVTKRYGDDLLRNLPAALPRTSSIEQIRRFWKAR